MQLCWKKTTPQSSSFIVHHLSSLILLQCSEPIPLVSLCFCCLFAVAPPPPQHWPLVLQTIEYSTEYSYRYSYKVQYNLAYPVKPYRLKLKRTENLNSAIALPPRPRTKPLASLPHRSLPLLAFAFQSSRASNKVKNNTEYTDRRVDRVADHRLKQSRSTTRSAGCDNLRTIRH